MTRANAAYAHALSTPPRLRTYRTRDRTILATRASEIPLASALLTPPPTIRTYAGRTRRLPRAQGVLEGSGSNSLEPHADVEAYDASDIDCIGPATPLPIVGGFI